MPLIESEQIELIDLTDSRPAFLSLSTSLPKMQTEERNVFSPDYTNEKTPQIITPTLFLGQEKINIKDVLKEHPIEYLINQQKISDLGLPEIYVSDNCLYIKKNLDASSWAITATIASLNYKGSQYQNITAETELFKVSSSTKQFLALLSSGGRSFFEPTNREKITLTATLYFGGETYKGDVEYEWYENGAKINNKNENEPPYEYAVTIDDVQAMSNYHCSITVKDMGDKYLTPSITIMDKTDPYSAQIISSKGLIFSTDNDETELDCRVYQSNKELISPALNYKWYKEAIIKGNELNKNDDGNIVNTKTIDVRPQDENTTEVTYYCVAKINETEIVSQITLMVAPRFNTIITPKQIFVPFIGDKYNGTGPYKMQFYLKFLKAGSQNVPIGELSSVTIDLGDVNDYFDYSLNEQEITFTTKEEDSDFPGWSNFPDSSICSIYYTYNGAQLQEEFYFIKSIAGVQPTISYAYWRGNTADQSKIPPDATWKDNINEVASATPENPYLWTRITISYNDGRQSTVTYSVMQDGFDGAGIDKIDYWYQWYDSGDTWPTPGPSDYYIYNGDDGVNSNNWIKNSIPQKSSDSLKYLWVKTITIIVDKFGEKSYSETNARDGVDGTSITGIDYDYARWTSDSMDDINSLEWRESIDLANSAIPSGANKNDYVFLWTRTKTTLSDGSETSSYSVVKDGSNVNAIDHIEYYYARSDSKTEPPSSGWEKDINNLTNKDLPYLWQKMVIFYTGEGVDPTESYMVVEDGDLMTGVTVQYLYSNNASINPDDAAPANNKPTWYNSKDDAADNNSKNYPYLWTKTTYTMNKGEKISYSVSDRNKVIKSTEELYAVGIKASGTITEDSVTKTIDLSILFNCNTLTWVRDVPRYGQDGEGKVGNLNNSDTIKVIITPVKDKNTTVNNIDLTEEESLWIKYIFTYDDNSTGESDPFPINAFDDFRRSASYVEVLRNDSSIQSIVGKNTWGEENQTLESYLTQLPEKIQASIVIDDKYATYFTLHSEGLIIGKNTSKYTTFIDNDGFNIHYYENGYDPEQPNNDYKVVGTFDANGLNTKQISLQDLSNSNSKIIVKGTETGGWSWVKGG